VVQAFDVVDLDPYGSPCTLLDSAVQSVAEGGLLMVTATDVAVLCGNTAEACFTKYGSYSLHREYCHEQALRIILGCVAQHAARHKRVIEPVLSLSVDFYVRMFMRVRSSASDSKFTASMLSYVWQSSGCESWWLQPVGTAKRKGTHTKFQVGKGPAVPNKCPISGGKFLMGGPIWNGPLHAPEHVTWIFDNISVCITHPSYKLASSYYIRKRENTHNCCMHTI
jgi:tRNA (guanine26-N2/guanine27-N2)-dimethyltransferase